MAKKCSNCGKCCAEEVCEIGIWLFGDDMTPCRALVPSANKKWLCGVVLYSGRIHKVLPRFFADIIGIGKGCDNEEFVGVLNFKQALKGGE